MDPHFPSSTSATDGNAQQYTAPIPVEIWQLILGYLKGDTGSKQRCQTCDSSNAALPNLHGVGSFIHSNPICLVCWDSFAELLDVTSDSEYPALISFKPELFQISPAGSDLANFGSL